MSELLVQLAEAAAASYSGADDVLTAEYLQTCQGLLPIIDKFGTGFTLIRSDIGGNIDRLAAAYAQNSAKYRELFPVILDEVQRGEQEGKHSETNALLWLKRASDFIVALLHQLHDDQQVSLSTAANAAYYKTLYNNHTWYTSAAFVVVLKLVPSRQTFFQALGTPGQQMQQDLQRLLNAYEPLLARIQKFLSEHKLDFATKV